MIISQPGKPSILFHRGTEWRGVVRGSTNIFAEMFLAAAHPVAWMMRPRHLGHVLFRRGSDAKHGAWRAEDGALVIAPMTLVPRLLSPRLGGGATRWLATNAYRSIVPDLRKTFGRFGQPEPQLIFSTGGDMSGLRKYFPRAKRIVQCVDLYEAFEGPRQNRREEIDYADADHVICIGQALAEFLQRERRVPANKITVVGQGVDLAKYENNKQEPADLRDCPRPRLIWVGVLAKADAALMRAALGALPASEGSMVLIGPDASWARDLQSHDPRVRVLGPRAGEEVPAYLKHADVGLMLYDQNVNPMVYLGQNPLKLYEFAAAGLPIVSTPHEEYRYLNPPALVARTPEDVATCVRDAIARRDELGAASKSFASQHGWDRRFAEVRAVIDRVLGVTGAWAA